MARWSASICTARPTPAIRSLAARPRRRSSCSTRRGSARKAATAGSGSSPASESALAGHPLVRDVRGRGLFVGIELGPTEKGGFLARALPSVVEARLAPRFWAMARGAAARGGYRRAAGERSNGTCSSSSRRSPSRTTEIDTVVERIGALLDEYRDVAPILRDAGERLGKQLCRGMEVRMSLPHVEEGGRLRGDPPPKKTLLVPDPGDQPLQHGVQLL